MKGQNKATKPTTPMPPLYRHKLLRRVTFNRLYIAVYATAVLTLLNHNVNTLLNSHSFTTFILSLLLLISHLTLALSWASNQPFHFRPTRSHEFPENLQKATLKDGKHEFPALDIFICTADPLKEPPMGVVNTALSVMAYDYTMENTSVYVSDDGGSQATLFAFMEAAKFARHWLPFCREHNVMERCPQAYFDASLYVSHSPEADRIKSIYESMKVRVENTVERGKIEEPHIDEAAMLKSFSKWNDTFSRQVHPTIIQVLLSAKKDKDVTNRVMPNLIYVSREKSKVHHHQFKAGALNTLVRVSAAMTNAPIILTLDCDMYSNDPQTVKRALCYFLDPEIQPTLAYVQFPQIFHGLSKGDIYHSEQKRLFHINPLGLVGLYGPNYVGSGAFFNRRAFFGSPSSFIQPNIPELSPDFIVKKPIDSPEILELAHSVAACNYETHGEWGKKMGFRYGSLVEDYFTGYRLQCEGWRSKFCNPERPAFLGDSPVTLIDLLGQCKRWSIGLLDVLFSRRYSTVTYGFQKMGLLMSLAYTHYAIWPISCIPLTIYAFIPQLALLKGISIFPEISDPRFYLYVFLFVGANAKDLLDFILEKGTLKRWWNSQRMWMIFGLSSFLFGSIDYTLGSLGIAVRAFDLTSKQQDDELTKRYDQGSFEFGVASPMFVPITMAAIINLVTFIVGLNRVSNTRGIDENIKGLILQILLSCYVVINCKPIYEAMLFRSDKGRMPTRITLIAAFLASIMCLFAL